jgi:hypothetical protein
LNLKAVCNAPLEPVLRWRDCPSSLPPGSSTTPIRQRRRSPQISYKHLFTRLAGLARPCLGTPY